MTEINECYAARATRSDAYRSAAQCSTACVSGTVCVDVHATWRAGTSRHSPHDAHAQVPFLLETTHARTSHGGSFLGLCPWQCLAACVGGCRWASSSRRRTSSLLLCLPSPIFVQVFSDPGIDSRPVPRAENISAGGFYAGASVSVSSRVSFTGFSSGHPIVSGSHFFDFFGVEEYKKVGFRTDFQYSAQFVVR